MKHLLLAAVFLFTFKAGAVIDVTCKGDDCLQNGWFLEEAMTGQWSDVTCLGDDCRLNGWEIQESTGRVVLAQCLSGGCFTAGWSETAQNRGEPRVMNYCASRREGRGERRSGATDCLFAGWTTESVLGAERTMCRRQSCATEGWTILTAGREVQVYCKQKDCFRFGWKIYR